MAAGFEMHQDQRRSPRFPCSGSAEVHVSAIHGSHPARIENLSERGCRLVLLDVREIELEGIYELTFTVNRLPFRVRGQVRSIRGGGTIGVEFVDLSKRSRMYLQDLVQELAEQQGIRS